MCRVAWRRLAGWLAPPQPYQAGPPCPAPGDQPAGRASFKGSSTPGRRGPCRSIGMSCAGGNTLSYVSASGTAASSSSLEMASLPTDWPSSAVSLRSPVFASASGNRTKVGVPNGRKRLAPPGAVGSSCAASARSSSSSVLPNTAREGDDGSSSEGGDGCGVFAMERAPSRSRA